MTDSKYQPTTESICTRCNIQFKHYHPPCNFCGGISFFCKEDYLIRIFYCDICRDDIANIMKESKIERFHQAAHILVNSRLNKFNHTCNDIAKEPTC